jgi:hypothetical protein
VVSAEVAKKLGFSGFDFNNAVTFLMNMQLYQHIKMQT